MKVRAVFVLLLLALSSPVAARPDMKICTWVPGAVWQERAGTAWRAPDLTYDVFYIEKEELLALCGKTRQTRGCAMGSKTYAQIYIDEGLHVSARHCVLFHEYAHLPPNNWCSNHQGRCP